MMEPISLKPETLNIDYASAAFEYLQRGYQNCQHIIDHYPEPANIDLVFMLRDRILKYAKERFPGKSLL